MPVQYAIIHTPTRVIRRLTTDTAHPVSSDETKIEMATPIDLAASAANEAEGKRSWWKLDEHGVKVVATDEEADAAGLDEVAANARRKAAIGEMRLAVVEIVNKGATPEMLVPYFTALQKLL